MTTPSHIGSSPKPSVAPTPGATLGLIPPRGDRPRPGTLVLRIETPVRRASRFSGRAVRSLGAGVYAGRHSHSSTPVSAPAPAREGRGTLRGTAAFEFAAAGARYWTRVHPLVRRELRRWSARALLIPDTALRAVALAALEKRSNVEGAVVFAAFVDRAQRERVVRASATFQAAYDFLDVLTERPRADAVRYSLDRHAALLDALDLDAPRRDRGIDGDGGYLDAIVDACRGALAGLPSYGRAQAHALRAAERVVCFQGFNCGREQGDVQALARWAARLGEREAGLTWWELAASAGSSLGVLATIAAAAAPTLDESALDSLEHAYHPAIGALHSLLDQLADRDEDAVTGQLNLIANYGDADALALAMSSLAKRARASAVGLSAAGTGGFHALVLAAMAASYLSLPQTELPSVDLARAAVLAELGPLANASIAIFRGKRLVRRS